MDHQNWSACSNFELTRDNIVDYMVSAGASNSLDVSSVQNKDSDSFVLNESYCFPVVCETAHPNYCLVTYEMRGRISQKGNGHIRSAKLHCDAQR